MGSLTKALLGKDDMEIQTNTNATESFNRTSSTGGTVAIEKVPDIWDGTGKIDVADIASTAATITTITATTITEGGSGLIKGDTTTGRVLRLARLTIDDGTNASTLKCTLANLWNGDTIAATDNVAKGATTGNFTLDAAGTVLTVEAAGLSGNCIAVLSAAIARNASNISHPFCDAVVATNDIQMTFRQSQEIAVLDLTSMVDTGQVDIILAYITAA